MLKLEIPNGTWILVGDGAKALVLRNEGDEVYPNLVTRDVFHSGANPKTSEQGTDRPGRVQERATGRRSGMEPTDWHDIAEHRFAHHVAEIVERCALAGEIPHLIVVAPARTLADLRKVFSKHVTEKIRAEVDKDLTQYPVYKIEQLLTGKV